MWNRARAVPGLLVFIDEGCGLCRRVATVLACLSTAGRVTFLAARDLDAYTHDRALLDDRYVTMVAVAGDAAFRGYDAYVEIATRSTVLRFLVPVMRQPWARRAGQWLYERIARSRRCAVVAPR